MEGCLKRREFIAGAGGVVAWPATLFAQGAARRPLIAYLAVASREASAQMVDAFLQGLRELGKRDGYDFDIAYRFADGDEAKLPRLAEELVRLKPDVLYSINARVAKLATTTIPIVSPVLNDPVRFGLVASYAHPGGNVNGIMSTVDDLPGKQVELARELIPGLIKLGMLINVSSPVSATQRPSIETAAQALNVILLPVEVRAPDDLDPAFQASAREKAEALVVLQDTMFFSYRQRIAALAIAAKLPAIFGFRDHVDAGGLISYGVNLRANHRRAAAYVVEILKGAKPSELPVEFPTHLELIINLKTAKALGLTVPPTLLARADEVIE
jgi:putative tryptophan/tyrosine transport system substrate-binding protein